MHAPPLVEERARLAPARTLRAVRDGIPEGAVERREPLRERPVALQPGQRGGGLEALALDDADAVVDLARRRAWRGRRERVPYNG